MTAMKAVDPSPLKERPAQLACGSVSFSFVRAVRSTVRSKGDGCGRSLFAVRLGRGVVDPPIGRFVSVQAISLGLEFVAHFVKRASRFFVMRCLCQFTALFRSFPEARGIFPHS